VRAELSGATGRARWHLDTTHRAEDGRPERLIADLSMPDSGLPIGAARLRLGEVFDRGTIGIGTPFSADTLLGEVTGVRAHFQHLGVEVTPETGWTLAVQANDDSRVGRPAELRYGGRYQGSCWSLALEYVDLPDRNILRFRLALTGPRELGRPLMPRNPLWGDPTVTAAQK